MIILLIIQMNGIKPMCLVYGTVHIAGGERRGLEWFLISPEGLLRESKRGGQLAVSLTTYLRETGVIEPQEDHTVHARKGPGRQGRKENML